MYYSAIGLLAAVILLIENQEFFLKPGINHEKPVWNVYRNFLYAVLVYYITDIAWGILESRKLAMLLFADTTVYFVAMAAGVLFWAQFIVGYFEKNDSFGRALLYAGRIIAGAISVMAVVNIFRPVLFTVDAAAVYTALPLRYFLLVCQIVLLLHITGMIYSLMQKRSV